MADSEAAKVTASSSAVQVAGRVIDNESSSPFQCCVCLDLLYKPVVLACGHMSCFWCVNKAMNWLQASCCVICRRPYKHFPSICLLLHYLILKLEPVAYKRREMEVLEEEKKSGIYSPQFMDQSELEKLNIEILKTKNSVQGKTCVGNVSCSLCKELLYRPVVLNCGHGLPIHSGEPLRCHVCQCLHPDHFPNVCFDPDHFLKENFPRDYAVRREQVQLRKAHCQAMNTSLTDGQTQRTSAKLPNEALDLWVNEDMSEVHVGVGCDCGVYSINGKRYKCQDCKESIGFDLCEACYNTTSKLPGGFNQQHTLDHEFEIDD